MNKDKLIEIIGIMKVTILACLAGLTLASFGSPAQAGVLEDACDQKKYTFDEFLRLSPFLADVDRIVDLPGPPTFATALSGPDRCIVLRTKAGETIVIDNVPTSLGGNFCGTINAWLPIKEGATYTFPDVLRLRPNCTQIYVK